MVIKFQVYGVFSCHVSFLWFFIYSFQSLYHFIVIIIINLEKCLTSLPHFKMLNLSYVAIFTTLCLFCSTSLFYLFYTLFIIKLQVTPGCVYDYKNSQSHPIQKSTYKNQTLKKIIIIIVFFCLCSQTRALQ